MFGMIARMFQRRDDDALFGAAPEIEANLKADEEVSVRRWDAADTHRLNASQFEGVTGQTINEDLVSSLPVLMARCAYEASTNPTIEGMIDTHAIDIVGPDGPQWQVLAREPGRLLSSKRLQGQFKEYAQAAEEILQDWFKLPDLNGDLSGVEILTMDCNQQWTAGNSIVQVVDDDSIRRRNTIRLRWHPIHAERVFSNRLYGLADGTRVTLGIERTKSGKKKRYHVLEADEFGSFSGSTKYESVPAEYIIHRFRSREPGQICGVPMLASALPTIADIRHFDKLTMEAAKLGATFGLVFEDKFQDSPQKTGARKPAGVMSSVKAGIAQILTAPKGKTAVQVDPKHPGNNYVDFRNERFRDVGRASQMPLMIVRLGAEDHSYSSARFDAQIYQRGIRRDQSSILRKYSPSLMDVLREAELAGLIPMRPLQIEIGAIFARLPHVDPAKEARARESDLSTMSASLIDIWAEDGMRPQEMVAKLKRTVESLNEVKEGFGDAWLLNNMKKTNPAIIDKMDQQESSKSTADLAV
jgi:capsid protein